MNPRRNTRVLMVGATLAGIGLTAAVVGYFVLDLMALVIAGAVLTGFGFLLELRGLGLLGGSPGVAQDVPDLTDPISASRSGRQGGTSSTVSTQNPTDPSAYKKL